MKRFAASDVQILCALMDKSKVLVVFESGNYCGHVAIVKWLQFRRFIGILRIVCRLPTCTIIVSLVWWTL